MAEKRYSSSSIQRKVEAYLKPRTYMMFIAEKNYLIRGESEHMNNIVNKYYDGLPANHQQQLVEGYILLEKQGKLRKKK